MRDDEPGGHDKPMPGADDRAEGSGSAVAPPGQAAATSPRHRTARVLIAAVLAPILALALGAAAYVAYLDHLVGKNVRQEKLLPDDTNAPSRVAGAGAAENYLLIGSDRRPGETGPSRADVVMWVHIDKAHRRVDLVHMPRDYFVDIPGWGEGKVNAAYEKGGAPLLVQTLHPIFNTRIDHVAIVDFEGFSKMTDAIGGLDLDIPADMASPQFPAGKRHMDGATALTFVRERKALDQQDISRGKRQQLYLKTLLLRALSDDVLMNPVTFAKFVDAATQNLTLDETFPKDQLRDKAFELRGVRSDQVFFWSAPWTGVGEEGAAGAVVYPNDGLLTELGEHLAADSMPGYRDEETPETGFTQTPEQAARTRARPVREPSTATAGTGTTSGSGPTAGSRATGAPGTAPAGR